MSNPLKILMLEDSVTDAEIVQRLLKKEKPHCEFSLAMDREAYVLALDQFKPDIILADNSLPQFSAAEALEISRRSLSHTPFIMVTDTESEESDTDIIKLGADDYILKDRLMRLPVAIEAALKQQNAEKEKLAAIEKLNLNEENYRNMVERISDGFIALDLNWRFTYINKKAEQLFRRPPGSLTGKQIWSEFPETIDRPFYKAYHKAMETQENSYLKEYSVLLQSWVEANIYPSLSGISIYFRDITEQKKAEEKLKEREEKYRSLVEDATDGIFIAGSTGDLLDANTSLCTMFGCTKEEMLKANFRDGLFEEDLKNNPIRYDELKEGLPLLRELRIKKMDGSALYVEISSRMLPDGQIQGIVRNISERKKREEQLKESEEKYRNLIERTSDGVLIYSLDGAILDFNHSSYNYLGYTKEEMRKLTITNFFFEEDLKRNPLSFERLKAGNSTIDYRRLKRKDGSGVEMEISTTMLPDGSLMAFGRDITERKKMEEEQRSNLEELAAIYKLSNSLSRANSVEEIFTEAMNSLRDTIHTDRTSILLFDPDGVMRFKAWQNLSDEYRQAVEGHSPWSQDTKNAEPIFVINVEEDPGVEQWRSYFKKEGISALGFIPIMQNGNLIGKFMLYSNTPRIFSTRESQLAQNIASHVAFAIERQKAEKELRLKENAISASISGMGMTDLTGKIIYANEALGKMWGCTGKEELIGKMLTDVFEGPRVFQTMEGLRTKGFENGEDVGKKMDGTTFNVAFSANVTQDEKGNPVCMFGSFIDITKRKNAEEEIITEKLLSDSIINSLPGIFYLYDENGKFLRWNKNFETVTEYYAEEIKKMHPLDFYDTDQKELIRKRIERVFKGKEPGIEALLFTKGRKKIPFFYNSLCINYKGRPCLMGVGIDISEQKKSQEEIKLSHERYEAVSKATSDAIWDYDFATGKTYIAGEGYKYLFGYNLINQYSEELFWETRLHPDDKERILTELNTVIANPDITQSASEYRFLKADGSYAYVYDRFFIIRENGNPVRMLGAKQDITVRKKAEEETRRSNERFEMVARATNDAVWELDLLTGESWYNDTFLLLFGTDPYGAIIKPTVEFWRSKLHPDDRERVFINLYNTCAGSSSVWADEFRFQRPDDSYGIFYDRGFIQRDGSGKAVRITGSMIDITELKQVQRQLKESEEKYRNLVEEASDAIFINDKHGNLLDANKSAGNMLGYTKEQFCTMKVTDLYTAAELASRPIILQELLSGERTSLERNMKHKNGSLIPVDITAKMLADGRIIAIVRDNSERKKAEEEIRRSNDRFQSLSKATNDAVWDWDLITDNVWWSESFYNFLGFDPKLPVPDLYEWTKKIHPDDRDQVLTKLKGIRKNNANSWEDEFRFQLADGSYGTALDRAYVDRDDTGKPVRLIGALMDITQRKKTEEEIKKSNERFLLISKATNDAVWDWNLQTNEIWWNEAHYKQFGFDPNKPMPGQKEFLQKIHPADREMQDRKLEEIQKKIINGWHGEVRFLQADGSYGTIFQRCFTLYDEYNKPIRLVGASIDITEQKRLVKEMEVLSIIAKETSNGVLIFDKGNEHILWINEGFTRLTGYTLQDMYGNNCGSILYGMETDQRTIEYINNQKAGNLPYSADILIYTKNGEKKWHYISGQPIPDENGQITKYFVLSTDISDRLRMEQERLFDNIRQQKEVTRAILHAQEAERNELGRELHDNINQILSAISMKLDFCIENYPTSKIIAEDCRQNVQDAIKETRNLSHRMVMPRFSEMSLKNILRSLVANYSTTQTVQLDTDQMKEKDIPAAVKETLFRIVQEQLSNIQKHAKADKIRIRLSNDPSHVAMLIEDNGIGFDTQQKRKGIGITNILNRVESYNGAVDIISQPGKGCTLSVNIPLTGLNDHIVANGF